VSTVISNDGPPSVRAAFPHSIVGDPFLRPRKTWLQVIQF
jgi:hypothetical protein